MALVSARIAMRVFDKAADTWYDVHQAEVRTVGFFEEITRSNDEDLETDLGAGAESVDINLTDGLEFYRKVSVLLSALRSHVSEVGGYTSMNEYLAAQRFRVPRYAADRCWADSGVGSTLSRLYVCPEVTSIASHVQGGACTDIGDIPATAGPARMRCNVGAGKGVAAWTPDIHTVCEGPASTLDGAIADDATTISLVSATQFPAGGGAGFVGSEAFTYVGKDGDDLTGVTRAQYGTVAAAHVSGTTVYYLHTYTPTIRASAQTGLLVDFDVTPLTDDAPAGTAGVPANGVGAQDWVPGNYLLLKDHTCPELLTQDTLADDEVHVADAQAFSPGDLVILHDDTPTTEWNTILNVNYYDNIIYLDAATVGNFAIADSALICLGYTTINEGGLFAFNDNTLTVAAGTCANLPTEGTLKIGDEEMTFNGVGGGAGEDITITLRGANGTTATNHEDGSVVILVQEGTYPGHAEWAIVTTVNANDLVLASNLVRTYYLAAFMAPLQRDIILIEDGAGGNAGDVFTAQARPDTLISKSG